MTTLYKRHTHACRSKSKKSWKDHRCSCPYWMRGTVDGLPIGFRSCRTADKKIAEQRLNERIAEIKAEARGERGSGGGSASNGPVTSHAVERFLADLDRRALNWETRRKYKAMLGQLSAQYGSERVKDLTVEIMSDFVTSWNLSPLTQAKGLERLRAFFRFCVSREWCTGNPAKEIKAPKSKPNPTLPYTGAEMVKILHVCDPMERAFVLVMRYSGLRVGDTARLEKHRIQNNKLLLPTEKTGQTVHVPLPQVVIDALNGFAHASDRYYFWSGKGAERSAAVSWMDRLRDRVFSKAGVEGARSHRFRDTFSVEHLLAGTPIEIVSTWLGHSSIRVTEKHYSPWIKSRQEQADQFARGSWASDPLTANSKAEGVQ
jgi:integrase